SLCEVPQGVENDARLNPREFPGGVQLENPVHRLGEIEHDRDVAALSGPDPSTHSRCTLGGMIGNNSCGTHSLLAGKTVDNIDELTVLLYDGTEMRVGATSDGDLESI